MVSFLRVGGFVTVLFSFDRAPNFVFPNVVAERIRSLPKVKDLGDRRSRYMQEDEQA